MANEKVSQLPTVGSATKADVIYAIQSGTSVQETLQQVLDLTQSNIILSHAGDPNGFVAGTVYILCYDTTNSKLYICTSSGSVSTAVWTLIGALVVAPVQGGTGISNPALHSLPIAQGAANFHFVNLLDGQLLIGSTGAEPVAAELTAGTNMSIVNNAGQIILNSTGGGTGFTWNNTTASTQQMLSNNGYVSNNSGGVTFTLPVSPAFADIVEVVGLQNKWQINQNSGQSIIYDGTQTTVGVGGSLSSIVASDTVTLICNPDGVTWTVKSGIGTLTVV